jgi:hypothetical protein
MALTKVRGSGIDADGQEIILDADTDTTITADTDDQIDFKTGGSDRLTIGSSGNVGIGTSSPKTFSGQTHLTINHPSGGTNVSGLSFQVADTEYSSLLSYPSNSEGLRLATVTALPITFQTNNSERMRVDSDGRVMVGTTSSTIGGSSGSGNEGVILGGALGNAIAVSNSGCLDLNRKTSNGTILEFRFNGSSVGSISTNANSLPSDKNFKRDIKDLNIGLDLVSQLQPKSFNLIVDNQNSPVMYGLVAQDLEIALEKVGVTKNSAWILQHEEKNDAKESDYSLDYSKLIPILINSVKELSAKNDALEARIKKLEDG